jgi:hypothetical protein
VPVEDPADQCHCRWTVTFHQDGEGRLTTAAGPQHQDRVVDMGWRKVGGAHLLNSRSS